MGEESHPVGIFDMFKEYKSLKTLYECNNTAQHNLIEHTTLLQEELRTARDAERATDFKKNRCQIFLSQQEEVILKLLTVKEENEALKQMVHQMERTISDLKNNNHAEILKKDEELQSFKQDYLKQLIRVQESADKQVLKEKNDLASTIERLQATITKNEELLRAHDNNIALLKTENIELKERINTDIIIFEQKLVNQERKYHAELETWKIAELNRRQQQPLDKNTLVNYSASSLQSEPLIYEHQGNVKSTQNQSTTKQFINPVIPNRIGNLTTSGGKSSKSTFLSVRDVYFKNISTINKTDEEHEDSHINNIDGHDQHIIETKSRNLTATNKKRKLLYDYNVNLL